MISQNADRRVLASQRQVMQYLRAGDWNIVAKLPVAATAGALNRLADYGWIERRGGGPRSEIKLTAAGLAALQAPIGFGRITKALTRAEGKKQMIKPKRSAEQQVADEADRRALNPLASRQTISDSQAEPEFQANHERLRAERLAREAKVKK